MRRLTTKEFIKKAKTIHKDKYIYDKTLYTNSRQKVIITCPIHGDFEQLANAHLKGQGCPQCCHPNKVLDKSIILKQFKEVHGNKYDYSQLPDVLKNHDKVPIICYKHGIFVQTVSQHKIGQGCPKCASIKQSERQTYSWEELVNKFNTIHNGKYDYSKAKYSDMNTPICIVCPIHGEFWQKPSVHIRGAGCQKCNSSKGEILISSILKDLDIVFEPQYKIIINSHTCYIDFKFTYNNIIYYIEYNGEQHYVPIEHFGGKTKFQKQVLRDTNVRNYCKENNITLIEIPYTMNDKDIYSTIVKQINYGPKSCSNQ